MKVEYIDHMGNDLSVVDAARVSFDKESQPVWRDNRLVISERDKKLLAYLAKHNHWSPFAHITLSVRVTAPIFVARQLAKHQVGLAWNEVSRRYVDSEPEFYVPDGWRKRADNVKQGSSNEMVNSEWDHRHLYEHQLDVYKRMLEMGVCPEQARMVLPQSMMTSWVWTGSLYAFTRVCKLRLDAHTQRETQKIAKKLAAICEKTFPESWNALMNEGA